MSIKLLRSLAVIFALVVISVGLYPYLAKILFPISVLILFGAFLAEKMVVHRRKVDQSGEFFPRILPKVAIHIQGSKLLVSDKWRLTKALELDSFKGHYSLEITELLKGVSSVIKRVRIANIEEMPGNPTEQVFQVPVDSGFLLFLSSDSVHAFSPDVLEGMITSELEQIPPNKPMLLWLKDNAGNTVGVVTSSGYGDGGYKLTYVKKDDVTESVDVLFIPDIEPDEEPISI